MGGGEGVWAVGEGVWAVAACQRPMLATSVRIEVHAPRARIRQDLAMPVLAAQFDWADRSARPEHVYIHTQLLLAVLIDPLFDAELKTMYDELADDFLLVMEMDEVAQTSTGSGSGLTATERSDIPRPGTDDAIECDDDEIGDSKRNENTDG